MAIIKCKMCGGDIELSADKTYGTCDSCGSTMTFPKVSDEQRANLFNRANHFRRLNDFDKAVSAYERILNEDNTDAEAHWGVVLSRFGIEYVEDPVSHERIPTCHRVQSASILTDADYLASLEYAPDGYSRELYENEARRIAEIQKGILAISAQEKPYDVFICYKETTDGGSRTKDSTLAQDIYYQLKQEGFNVFFARITLEDKLGQQYEPYIFAALNSAKVMLVVGTKPEHFNAVWVKNEWSRYLALMQQDRSRLLIPCYRDMDAYELPDELAALQSQDMSKIGFMQDLIRGVKKVLSTSQPKPESPAAATAPVSAAAPLLRRAFMFLEDGDWTRADEFCEQVLNLEPENAEAYLGKLMTALRVSKREQLPDCAEPFNDHPDYAKALRFGNAKLKAELQGCIQHINDRNEQARLEALYQQACVKMEQASTKGKYDSAAEDFERIASYKDAKSKAAACREKAEIAHKDEVLRSARQIMLTDTESAYNKAIQSLQTIPRWQDADALILVCQQKIQELKARAEAERLERERAAEQKTKKRKQRNTILAVLAVATVAMFLLVTQVIIPNQKYDAAVALMNEGKYNEAIAAFTEINGHKDSAEQIIACETAILDGKYDAAVALMNEAKYEEAIAAFNQIADHKDSAEQIVACETAILDGKYDAAMALMATGQSEAYDAFVALGEYKDSTEKATFAFGNCRIPTLKRASVGDSIIFGRYEQDNIIETGKEPIEWLVLAKDGTRLLVVSSYALDCQQFNKEDAGVSWETCTLRTWLNNDFLNAFSADEQALIPTATVLADTNPNRWNSSAGNDTQDKIFLLSVQEVNKYFSDENAKRCKPTAYALTQGLDAYSVSSSGFCDWWLRSRGEYLDSAEIIHGAGGFEKYGIRVTANRAVRPALWIDFEP